MEREACVYDHGFERSDLCAEIIIIRDTKQNKDRRHDKPRLYFSVPASPDQGHDRLCRRGVGRVFLAGVRPDSPSRRRIPSCYRPSPGRGGGVGSARCSLGTHPPRESSTCQRFKRRHVRRFGACAEADDTVVESWCVLSAPGV